MELADRHKGVYACVGIHPHEAGKTTDDSLREIESLSANPRAVAVGEIGLDYHYDFAPREKQREVFLHQIRLAIQLRRPIVVHTRDSVEEAISLVEQCVNERPDWMANTGREDEREIQGRGVFHCFSGSAEQAEKLFRLGFYVSFPGIVTFKKSPVVPVLQQIGITNILVETDSPYMTPVPFRGRRNEPSYITYIGKKIAEILKTDESEIARITSRNAEMLFNLPTNSSS